MKLQLVPLFVDIVMAGHFGQVRHRDGIGMSIGLVSFQRQLGWSSCNLVSASCLFSVISVTHALMGFGE